MSNLEDVYGRVNGVVRFRSFVSGFSVRIFASVRAIRVSDVSVWYGPRKYPH